MKHYAQISFDVNYDKYKEIEKLMNAIGKINDHNNFDLEIVSIVESEDMTEFYRKHFELSKQKEA